MANLDTLPDVIPIEQALRELAKYQAVSVERACRCLADQLESVELLALYKKLFPRQYARSTASSEPGECTCYTQREIEFFELIDRQLFPIWDCFWDECEERADYIPLMPMGFDLEIDEDDWPFPARVFYAMMTGEPVDRELLDRIGPKVVSPTAVNYDSGLAVDWKKFEHLCHQVGGLFRWIPTAMDLIGHSTGNFWLDISYESLDGYLFDWDVDHIKSLSAEWKDAERMWSKANRVFNWLDRNPRPLDRMFELWNRCVEVRKNDREQ